MSPPIGQRAVIEDVHHGRVAQLGRGAGLVKKTLQRLTLV
jgi:hypothetical protein